MVAAFLHYVPWDDKNVGIWIKKKKLLQPEKNMSPWMQIVKYRDRDLSRRVQYTPTIYCSCLLNWKKHLKSSDHLLYIYIFSFLLPAMPANIRITLFIIFILN